MSLSDLPINPPSADRHTSLSEYGCNKNTRAFQEVASLYGSNMTPVYSGGLVYEYSEEGSNYGLVTINGNSVTENNDFNALRDALAKAPAPAGDGNYKSSGSASTCPSRSSTWDVGNDALPAIPEPAKKYMTQGAGTGPGLTGEGSQNAGTRSTATATPGSGAVTSVASASSASSTQSKGAASSVRAPEMGAAPFVCGLVVLASTLFGAALL